MGDCVSNPFMTQPTQLPPLSWVRLGWVEGFFNPTQDGWAEKTLNPIQPIIGA